MRPPRGKRLALGMLVVALALFAVALFVSWDALECGWQLRRLRTGDLTAKMAAKEALEALCERTGPRVQRMLARELLEILGECDEDAAREDVTLYLASSLLWDGGAKAPAVFPLLVEGLEADVKTERFRACAYALADAWPASEVELARYFSGPDVIEKARRFFERTLFTGGFMLSDFTSEHAMRIRAPQVAAYFARSHAVPEMRALSLAYAMLRSAQREPPLHKGILREAFASDPSPLVHRAALRIAGAFGPCDRDTDIDLRSLLFREPDAALLTEVIEARALWAGSRAWPEVFEVAEGLPFHEIIFTRKPLPFEPEEVQRLEQILLERTEPTLCDAAAAALAGRYRNDLIPLSHSSGAAVAATLKVHEWSVWRDSGGLFDSKSVLSIGSAVPAQLLVQIELRGGRPSASHPEPTGHTRGRNQGLEWCGLLVGYGAELERSLSCDGVVELTSPVRCTWTDYGRRELLLEAVPPAQLEAGLFGNPRSEFQGKLGPVPWVFVIRKKPDADAAGVLVHYLSEHFDPVTIDIEQLEFRGEPLVMQIKKALEVEGLTEAEASALLKSYAKDFFETRGLRVITIVPRPIHDWAMPLFIGPQPGELVRVGLVWKELEV